LAIGNRQSAIGNSMRIVVLLLTLLLFTPVSGQTPPQLDTLRAEGYQALYNLDYEGARKRFQKMIDIAPEHPVGAQSYAASLWVQQLNEASELKATLYSTDAYTKGKVKIDRNQREEFRKRIRQAKLLSEARLRKNPRDVEALYYLGSAEGLEAAFAGAVERRFMTALRSGSKSVDHHREVLKLSPEFRDAELTIGLQDYIIGSLPLPLKMMVGTMGVRGSKKRGLETLEEVAVEGHSTREFARVLLVDLYKREKRWMDAVKIGRELAERYPRNYLFKLQIADALGSQILTLRKTKAASATEEKELMDIFASLFRDKSLDSSTLSLVHFRYGETLLSLGQPDAASKEFVTVSNRADADEELKGLARQRLEQLRKR
jgi:tetratricopeptide (TPR) repeat protein